MYLFFLDMEWNGMNPISVAQIHWCILAILGICDWLWEMFAGWMYV